MAHFLFKFNRVAVIWPSTASVPRISCEISLFTWHTVSPGINKCCKRRHWYSKEGISRISSSSRFCTVSWNHGIQPLAIKSVDQTFIARWLRLLRRFSLSQALPPLTFVLLKRYALSIVNFFRPYFNFKDLDDSVAKPHALKPKTIQFRLEAQCRSFCSQLLASGD